MAGDYCLGLSECIGRSGLSATSGRCTHGKAEVLHWDLMCQTYFYCVVFELLKFNDFRFFCKAFSYFPVSTK